jgi:hypothetical protein
MILLTAITKSQITVDSVYDFSNNFINSTNIFIRNVNIINNKIFVSLTYESSEDYLLTSNNQGSDFEIAAKDTSPYKWDTDIFGTSTKIYDKENRTPFSRMVCAAGDEILVARTKGILSRINYSKKEFVNDTITKTFNNTNAFNFIESFDNKVVTCNEQNVYFSDDYGKSWTAASPKLNEFGYDTSAYFLKNRKAVLLNGSAIYLFAIIYDIIGKKFENTFFKSTDFGKSWQQISKLKIEHGNINDFCLTPNGRIFISGSREFYDNTPIVKQFEWLSISEDDGSSWVDLISDSVKFSYSLSRVKFFDDNFGITYGSLYLHYTLDGGKNWESFYNPDVLGMGLAAAEFLDKNSILTSGIRVGYLKKVTFNSTDLKDLTANTKYLVFPNPATYFIEINLNKRLQPLVQNVQIFDMLGIEVMSVGTGLDLSTQRINISHLPAGVYYIKIENRVERFLKM